MKEYYPIIYAALTALCWGLYGPTLAQSRTYLKSPFKPYVAIGVAYLIWGIVGGLVGMAYKKEAFNFTGAGMGWGLAAGTLGAWGALTLTLAMFSGGSTMPHVVMSIVFGGAVTVSAIVSLVQGAGHGTTNPWLYVGMVGILVSSIMVAYCSPHAVASPSSQNSPSASAAETK